MKRVLITPLSMGRLAELTGEAPERLREWHSLGLDGKADLAGPDDLLEGLEPGDVPRLLQDVYAAAVGGTGDEWAELDPVMEAERHTAVLVRPARIYSNPDR